MSGFHFSPSIRGIAAGKVLSGGGLTSALLAGVLLLPVAAAIAGPAPQSEAKTSEAIPREISEALSAVVKIRAKALPDARTAGTLGSEREGSGIVIAPDGVVLTIGYLILEAEGIEVRGPDGRTVPATLVGYDQPTGFGLVRPLFPLPVKPIELGDSAALKELDVALIATHGGLQSAALAYVISRQTFAGYWEYLLEDAIFTAPPRLDHSGAALIGRDGRLLGVGSLFIADPTRMDLPVQANMFVPIDALKPILSDLITHGRSSAPPRPWLGANTEEIEGHLLVTRVSPESPAERAGLVPGDVIMAIGDKPFDSQADFYRKLWSRGIAGVEVPLTVLHGAHVRQLVIKSVDRIEYLRARPTY